MFIFMWWEKVKLGNNLLIKSNREGYLIIDYNQSSDGLYQICIKCLICFRFGVSVGSLFPIVRGLSDKGGETS